MKKLLAVSTTIAITASLIATPVLAANKTLEFSGYTWMIKSGIGKGPGPNNWSDDPSAVYVDQNGALHLSVNNVNGTWYSTEVYLPKSLGYGTYQFQLTFPSNGVNSDLLDRNLVAAPFLYQDDEHELDIEFSYWSDYQSGKNLSYSAQPSHAPNAFKYVAAKFTTMPITAVIDWKPTGISYSVSSHGPNGTTTIPFTYTGTNSSGPANFKPGKERLHINFWQNAGMAPYLGKNSEFIINSFSFTPATTSTTTPITEPAAPVTEETSPVTEPAAPVTEETDPVTEPAAPVTEETATDTVVPKTAAQIKAEKQTAKQAEKAEKQAEKAAEKAAKQAAKQAEKAEKQAEKAEKQAEKAAEKAAKQAAKQAEKAEKQATKNNANK